MTEKTVDLACIGSCCIDLIMNVEDVFRFEMMDAKQPDIIKKYTAIEYSSKLNVKSVKFAPGGSAANVAANLGNFGLNTRYIGKLGNDMLGKIAKDDLEDNNVNTESLYFTDEDSTATSVILITPFGKDRSILSYKGANNLIKPDEIKDEWITQAKHLQWTSLTSETGVASIEKCIDLVKKGSGGKVFACPSISIIKNNLDAAIKLVKKSDLLTLNLEEIYELTGEQELIRAMKKALSFGPKIVVVTNGGTGAFLTDGEKFVDSGVYDVKVVDTTGAGDAFASGIILAYMKDKTLEEMAKFGAAISAFECKVLGVRDGIPHSFDEVENFINTHDLKLQVSRLS